MPLGLQEACHWSEHPRAGSCRPQRSCWRSAVSSGCIHPAAWPCWCLRHPQASVLPQGVPLRKRSLMVNLWSLDMNERERIRHAACTKPANHPLRWSVQLVIKVDNSTQAGALPREGAIVGCPSTEQMPLRFVTSTSPALSGIKIIATQLCHVLGCKCQKVWLNPPQDNCLQSHLPSFVDQSHDVCILYIYIYMYTTFAITRPKKCLCRQDSSRSWATTWFCQSPQEQNGCQWGSPRTILFGPPSTALYRQASHPHGVGTSNDGPSSKYQKWIEMTFKKTETTRCDKICTSLNGCRSTTWKPCCELQAVSQQQLDCWNYPAKPWRIRKCAALGMLRKPEPM